MAEISNELIYEVLKSVQARQAKMDDKIDEMGHGLQAVRLSLNSVRQEIVGVNTELAGIHATLVRHEQRLDRIERRLELNEAPTL
jgi:septal ring factor EnvC (AmiA/AmiB activator)